MENNIKRNVKIGIISGVTLIFLITLGNSFVSVPTGNVAIKTRFGQVQEQVVGEGLNIKLPFIEKIVLMDCKIQKCEHSMEAASKDLQNVSLKLAVNYNINKEEANKLYREVGKNYQSIILEPAIYEAVKYGVSNYTAEELITMRGTVSDTIFKILETKVNNRNISIQNISILDMEFSKEYNEAIEQKQVAQQNAQKAQYELEKARVENEKKIENAKADAEVMKQQNQQITEETLRLKELENQELLIQKWSGNTPNVISGDNIFGMLNLDNEK